jgi:hypothetical protein
MNERLALADITALDCFIVPHGAVVPTSVGTAKSVTGVFDLAKYISDGKDAKSPIVIVSFTNLEILDLINRKADLFPISAAVLASVPGADYDVLFENSSYQLPQVEVTELIAAVKEFTSDVNLEAQELMGHRDTDDAVTEVDRSINKRAERISANAVRRAASTAPKPVDLFDIRHGGSAHHVKDVDEEEDDMEGDDA